MYNVSEDQIDDAVEATFDILQLEPDLADEFRSLLVKWLDSNNFEIFE